MNGACSAGDPGCSEQCSTLDACLQQLAPSDAGKVATIDQEACVDYCLRRAQIGDGRHYESCAKRVREAFASEDKARIEVECSAFLDSECASNSGQGCSVVANNAKAHHFDGTQFVTFGLLLLAWIRRRSGQERG